MSNSHDPREMGELMSLALDGTATEGERRRLHGHLAGCPECTRVWDAMNHASTIMARSPMMTPGAGFVSRVLAQLEERRRRMQQNRELAIMIGWVALVFTLGGLIVAAALTVWFGIPGLQYAVRGSAEQIWAGSAALLRGLASPFRIVGWSTSLALMGALVLLGASASGAWAVVMARAGRRPASDAPGS
jgi:predicted anti-sigma-YlaC factor YlaD